MLGRGCAVIGLLAAAACGNGGAGDGIDGGSDIDGGSPGDAPPPDASGPRRLTDSKIFLQRNSNTTIAFGLDPDGPGSCLSEYVLGCEVQACDSVGVPVRASAGVVTITTPDAEATFAPDEASVYPTTPAIDWDPGDTVSLSVEGSDDIAAFEVSVDGPGTVTAVTAPSFAGPVEVSRDQPLAFAWEGADTAVTGVVSCNAADTLAQARCVFPDGVMSGAIPAEVLGRLPACESGNLYVLTEERVLTGPPGLVVRFAARGPIISGTATFVE